MQKNRERILIVDDSATAAYIVATILSDYECRAVTNGPEALAMLNTFLPDLILLDVIMPGMDGFQVCEAVKNNPNHSDIPIVMVTSLNDRESKIKGLKAKADDFLSKPIDAIELRLRTANLLKVKSYADHLVALNKDLQEQLSERNRREEELRKTNSLLVCQHELTYQATHDALTGLLNRRAALELLSKELVRSKRQGGRLAIGMCDIDYFKKVNDTWGHQAGDSVLCGFAHILTTYIREYDVVARMGGEEFLVIAPIRAESEAGYIFDRLCSKIANIKMKARTVEIAITVSIGVAYSTMESEIDELMAAADIALYRAKAEGRNRVVHAAQS